MTLPVPNNTRRQYLYSLLTSDGDFCYDAKQVCFLLLKMASKRKGDMYGSVKRDGGVEMSKFQKCMQQSPKKSVSDVPDNFQDDEAAKSISWSPVTSYPLSTLSVLSPNIAHTRSNYVTINAAVGEMDCCDGVDCGTVPVKIDSADQLSVSQCDMVSSAKDAGQLEHEQYLSKDSGSSKSCSAVEDDNDSLEATAYLQYISMMTDKLSDSAIKTLDGLVEKAAKHMSDVKEFYLPHLEKKISTKHTLHPSVSSTRKRPVHPSRSFFRLE